MTPDMIYKARQNAKSRLSSSKTTEEKRHDNVTFRLGEIEHLPVADHIVDCVISNCVVNLSPDKPQVLKDIHRILKANGQGRIAISDVVLRPRDDNLELPEHLKTAEALACWVTGAPSVESLRQMLNEAGFVNIKMELKESSKEVIKQWLPGSGAEDWVISAEITATTG